MLTPWMSGVRAPHRPMISFAVSASTTPTSSTVEGKAFVAIYHDPKWNCSAEFLTNTGTQSYLGMPESLPGGKLCIYRSRLSAGRLLGPCAAFVSGFRSASTVMMRGGAQFGWWRGRGNQRLQNRRLVDGRETHHTNRLLRGGCRARFDVSIELAGGRRDVIAVLIQPAGGAVDRRRGAGDDEKTSAKVGH